jgi:hypothetical protein
MRFGVLLAASICAIAAPAVAAEPDAATVQRAAEQFDEGSRAYRASRFESAASHFEAAFAAVPSARALRNAMRSRDAAGQAARGATLAALAMQRYPKDDDTIKLAREVLAKHEASVGSVAIRCSAPCVLAIDKRAVIGGAGRERTIYLAPGRTKIRASFKSGGDAETVVELEAGKLVSVQLEPTAAAPGPPPEPEPMPEIVLAHQAQPAKTAPWYRSPALFFVSLGGTGVLTGVTIWSGVDTLTNPGKDAVREACVGQGTDCPEYRRGVGKQIRTNALIGVSAGLGIATVLIGALATDFTGKKPVDMSFELGPHDHRVTLRGSF